MTELRALRLFCLVAVLALPAMPASAADSTVAVLLSTRVGVPPARASSIVRQLSEALSRDGVTVPRDPDNVAQTLRSLGVADSSTCAGRRDCLVDLGRRLRVSAVVGVDFARAKKTLAIHLELLDCKDGSLMVEHDLVTSAVESELEARVDFANASHNFALKVLAALNNAAPAPPPPPAPPPAVVVDTPIAPAPAPAPAATAPAPLAAGASEASQPRVEASGSTYLPPWIAGGGAVVALGVTGTFGGLGYSDLQQYNSASTTTPGGLAGRSITRDHANQLASSGNTDLTVAAIGGAVTAALVVVVIYLVMSHKS